MPGQRRTAVASPPVAGMNGERPQKTVMFVVDKSGSMSGKKLEQAKSALKFVLNNLREGDLFNIVAYDSTVESFKPELHAAELMQLWQTDWLDLRFRGNGLFGKRTRQSFEHAGHSPGCGFRSCQSKSVACLEGSASRR